MPAVLNDIFRIAMNADVGVNNQSMINVFYCRINPVVDGSDATVGPEIATWLDTFYAAINADLSTDLVRNFYRVENVTQQILLPDQSIAAAGTAVGTLLPTQCAVYGFARTAVKGVRAAKYVGGYTEDANGTNGEVETAVRTRAETAFQNWVDGNVGVSGNGYVAVAARNTQPPFLPPVWTSDDLISRRVQNFWRTQRRRTSRQVGV